VGLQLKNPGLVIFRNGGYVNGQIKTQIKPDCFALGALLVKPHEIEALAIQLEFEDEQLKEWRGRMHTIKEKGKA